jgi:hypothetical protein
VSEKGIRDMNLVEIKRAQRFIYLKRLYEITNGSLLTAVKASDLGSELGWENATCDSVITYLISEGLIKYMTFGHVVLTHSGVKQIEAALSQPDIASVRFPAANVIVIVNGDFTIGGDIVGRDKTTT